MVDFEIRDHYGDGDWYDAEYVHIGGDIPYYTQVAQESQGPILELACGTGRLSLPMAKTGAQVHGIDIARTMIERAKQKRGLLSAQVAERLSFDVGDMRTLRVEERYGAVVLAFNTLMHMLEDDDLLAALKTAKLHLLPRGLFYFDIHTPFPELLNRDPKQRHDPQQMIDPHTGARFLVTDNNDYNPRTQINTIRFFYQRIDPGGSPLGKELRAELKLRVLFPRELDLFLSLAGFEVIGDWDDFERTKPFSGKGGRRVVVARAA